MRGSTYTGSERRGCYVRLRSSFDKYIEIKKGATADPHVSTYQSNKFCNHRSYIGQMSVPNPPIGETRNRKTKNTEEKTE